MKKSLLVISIAALFVMVAVSMASAVSTAGYGPIEYTLPGPNATAQGTNWGSWSAGMDNGYDFVGFTTSTHPYGTWNSPYMAGVDGYNYNDPQEYATMYTDISFLGMGPWTLPNVPGSGVNAAAAGYIGLPFGDPALLDPMTGFTSPEPNPQVVPMPGGPYTFSYGFVWNTMMPGPMGGMWFPVFQNPVTGKMNGSIPATAGPHGQYTTTTHKCRDCHAVHRASGKFRLTRSDTREEACDWCHGKGAGSGFNIEMDNDDNLTKEYNVGHSLGFGLAADTGKWKAPDDTDPAYNPRFVSGGFSCFDCHSPHGNKERILGYIDNQRLMGPPGDTTQVPGFILDSGNTSDGKTMPWPLWDSVNGPSTPTYKPLYAGGRYLLLENPDDQEPAMPFAIPGFGDDSDTTTTVGGYAVNKVPISWNMPFGTSDASEQMGGNAYFNMGTCMGNAMSEFCADCHDGNVGLHIQASKMFSEDQALRGDADPYDIGYSHDSQPRHCGRQMRFNPDDADTSMTTNAAHQNPGVNLGALTWPPGPPFMGAPMYLGAGSGNFGPHCRNCHRGGSRCDVCHENLKANKAKPVVGDAWGDAGMAGAHTPLQNPITNALTAAAADQPNTGSLSDFFFRGKTLFPTPQTTGFGNGGLDYWRHERTVYMAADWRTSDATTTAAGATDPMIATACADDGFSWPHRTLGWKMLKDEMWGLDFDGTTVAVGQARDGAYSYVTTASVGGVVIPTGIATSTATIPASLQGPAQDLDSSCLDCHDPDVWRPTDANDYTDSPTDPNDNFNNELILRGLP